MAESSPPVPSGRRSIIPTLFNDGRIANQPERYNNQKGGELVEKLKQQGYLSDGFAVVDPRFVGYSFPSYTFIETKNQLRRNPEPVVGEGSDRLSQALNVEQDDFDRPHKALMMGTVLGDFDVIHRRVDQDRYANARFVKDAKMNEFLADLDFFQNTETYPIFEIIRWHGKNSPTPLNRKPDRLKPIQLEIIRQLRNDASLTNQQIVDNIKLIAEHNADELLMKADDLNGLDDNKIETEREFLEEDNDIILGYSVDYDPSHFHLYSALMGITIEPGHDEDDAARDSGNHAKVRQSLLNNLADQGYDDDYLTNFTMPYITSGVGQNWGDIMVELKVDDVDHINEIARRFRNLPGVRTTRTYLMTNVNFNQTFSITNYHNLLPDAHRGA